MNTRPRQKTLLDIQYQLRETLPDAGNLDAVLSHVRKRLGDEVEVLILSADICRDDLLLEIEGVWVGTIRD